MKKTFLIVAAFIAISSAAEAQNKTANSLSYRTAAGIKIWNGVGLNLKTFIDSKRAIDLIGFFNGSGTRITGLYEIHGDLNTESNLKWYFGPGVHVGFYKGPHTYAGLDGVVGLDYKFKDYPLDLSLDWQPAFEFGSGNGFIGDWGGIGVRYTF